MFTFMMTFYRIKIRLFLIKALEILLKIIIYCIGKKLFDLKKK